MAFETSDKSGLNNGRTSRLDISNINQSGLKGETVYTDEELLQLIIDNISKMEVPAGTQDSNRDGKIDVNDLIFSVSEGFKRYAKTQTDKVTLPNLIDALTKGISTLDADFKVQKKVAEGLQKKLDTANRAEKGEKNPVLYSSGTIEQNKLHPIVDIVRATEKSFVEQKNITGDTTKLAQAISKQPGDLASPLSEYTIQPEVNAKTLAETVGNLWLTIADLRMSVREIIAGNDRVFVARMGGIHTFFVHGPDCIALLNAAKAITATHSNARDIWNESGILFDSNVPSFTSNVATVSTECLNGAWYVVIGATGNTIGRYSRIGPHWTNVGNTCPAPEVTYTDPSTLEL